MANETYIQRVRVTFATGDSVKYVGHLDLARAWERAIRRARLPLAYTQGFNPQPRLQFAAALPVGYTSQAELADIFLNEALDPEAAVARLAAALPEGIRPLAAVEVPREAPSLQSQVVAASYRVAVYEGIGNRDEGVGNREQGRGNRDEGIGNRGEGHAGPLAGTGDEEAAGEAPGSNGYSLLTIPYSLPPTPYSLRERLDAFWGQAAAPRRRRRGKEFVDYDLRPLVLELAYEGPCAPPWPGGGGGRGLHNHHAQRAGRHRPAR